MQLIYSVVLANSCQHNIFDTPVTGSNQLLYIFFFVSENF